MAAGGRCWRGLGDRGNRLNEEGAMPHHALAIDGQVVEKRNCFRRTSWGSIRR